MDFTLLSKRISLKSRTILCLNCETTSRTDIPGKNEEKMCNSIFVSIMVEKWTRRTIFPLLGQIKKCVVTYTCTCITLYHKHFMIILHHITIYKPLYVSNMSWDVVKNSKLLIKEYQVKQYTHQGKPVIHPWDFLSSRN